MIEIDKVGIDIDGKVYEMYKMNFGLRRKLIEVQLIAARLVEDIAKKAGVEPDRDVVMSSNKVSEINKLEIGEAYLNVQTCLNELFVKPEEASIIDKLDDLSIAQLIGALQ